MLAEIFAFRKACFTTPSDCFDGFIFVGGLLGIAFGGDLSGTGILRLFRVAHVMKALKASTAVDDVRGVITGIGSGVWAITVGSAFIFFVLFIFAIASVILLNPVKQEIVRSGAYEIAVCECSLTVPLQMIEFCCIHMAVKPDLGAGLLGACCLSPLSCLLLAMWVSEAVSTHELDSQWAWLDGQSSCTRSSLARVDRLRTIPWRWIVLAFVSCHCCHACLLCAGHRLSIDCAIADY